MKGKVKIFGAVILAIAIVLGTVHPNQLMATGQADDDVQALSDGAPVLKSITVSKDKDFVKPGDKVEFRIKVEHSAPLSKTGSVILQPAIINENDYEQISLVYNDEKAEYEGVFDVTEDTYPCEWYVAGFMIFDDDHNNMVYEANEIKNHYIMVKNGNTFENPTYTVSAVFNFLDKNGDSVTQEFNNLTVNRRSTWKEVLSGIPDGSTTYEGLVFQGWEGNDNYGNAVTLDDEILEDGYRSFEAKYDKKIVKVNYHYPDKNLSSVNGGEGYVEKLALANDATYQDVYDHINQKRFSDLYDQAEFVRWDFDNIGVEGSEEIPLVSNFNCYAKFKDKIVVQIGECYYDENYGDITAEGYCKTKYELVNKGTTYQDLWENLLNKRANVKHYEGLRFKEWSSFTIRSAISGEVIQEPDSVNYAYFDIAAEYENCMVSFKLRNSSTSSQNTETIYLKPFVVEKGEMITIPHAIDGFKNIEWDPMLRIQLDNGEIIYHGGEGGTGSAGDGPKIIDMKEITIQGGDSLKITNNTDFYGFSDSVNSPTDPLQPNTPDINPAVNNKLSQQTIQETITQINNAKDGEIIEVSMGKATIVPKSILEALKGKNVTVNLNMNGYTWSINGKEIMSNNLQDINLVVTMNTNNIPNKIIDQFAQGNPVKQLSLAHSGEFGFKANLSFNIGEEFKGKYGNLYYYDSDGKMVYMNAGKIKDDGKVSLSFSHASDYAVVISDKMLLNESTPNTGDSTNASLYVLLLMTAFGTGCYVLWKKRKEMA